MPLTQTVDIVLNLLFEKKKPALISKTDLKKLLQLATSGTHFMFEGKFYYQKDGVVMRSPLRPVLANLFVGYHDQKWLQSFEVILNCWYAVDIICLLALNLRLINFFIFLNQRHPKIKFTIKKQTENQLSFLDLFITRSGDNFLTSVYLKKHSICLYTKYLISTPFSCKIGLVKPLLHRAFFISSNW